MSIFLRIAFSVSVVLVVFYFVQVIPYSEANAARLESKNAFIEEVDKAFMEKHGRRMRLGEPEMDLIHNFKDREVEIQATVDSIEKTRYLVAVFLFLAFSLGVCRVWAAGFIAGIVVFPWSPQINYFTLFWPYVLSVALGMAVAYTVGRWKAFVRRHD